jgi:hypothetical protein
MAYTDSFVGQPCHTGYLSFMRLYLLKKARQQ